MDVSVNRGGTFTHPFPSHWNAFAYVFSGSGSIGGVSTDVQHAYVLEQGDFIEATTANAQVCNMGGFTFMRSVTTPRSGSMTLGMRKANQSSDQFVQLSKNNIA
jgi:hypothetical protein